MSTSARRGASPEPFLWLLFSAGGMAAALVLPAVMLLFGLLVPLGVVDTPTHLPAIVRNPVTKLVLIGVAMLALWHAAHRFRFTFEHALQLGRFDRAIALCCYGAALLGSVGAIWILVSV